VPKETEKKMVAVVVIDDNPRSLEFVAAALTRPGVEVFSTSRPAEGLELVRQHHPKLVLTDVIMPGMTGIDVLHKVKEFDPTIDVVLMSARESGASPSKALREGAADFLRKPIALSVLRERVGRRIQEHLANLN